MTAAPRLIHLAVGVAPGPADAGWLRVLQQEGLPHRSVEGPEAAPVIVFSEALPGWVEEYVAKGGVAVVSGAPEIDGLLPAPVDAVISGFETPATGRWCHAPALARLFPGSGEGLCRLHEQRVIKNGMDPGRYPLVLTRRIGDGVLLVTGVPLTRLLMARGDTLRRFSTHTPVTERVASVDKAVIADTLVWLLRRAFAMARLPYVSPTRFPDGDPSVLIFRVDVDGAFGERTAALVDVADAHGVPLSIYVNGQFCEEYPGRLEDWSARHELGQHGWVHNLFDTVEDNLANLQQGAAWLERRTSATVASFVAPRGMWNPALGYALAELGYRYSADFGLDFDSLPFRVAESGVLQIPVHPYSPERAAIHARERGLPPPTASQVAAQYLAVLDDQVRARRPVHLYGHPEVLGTMAASVLPAVFQAAAQRGLRAMTLAQFAAWWERRENARMSATWDATTSTVTVDYPTAEPLPTRVCYAAGANVVVTAAQTPSS